MYQVRLTGGLVSSAVQLTFKVSPSEYLEVQTLNYYVK